MNNQDSKSILGSRSARQETGKLGEQAAFEYLIAEGYEVIERNWRCRSGEIDLIARTDDRMIFVEVRTRSAGGKFGMAAESVDYRKQRKIRETAQVYLRSTAQQDAALRFDVITVMVTRGQTESVIDCRHYPYAF